MNKTARIIMIIVLFTFAANICFLYGDAFCAPARAAENAERPGAGGVSGPGALGTLFAPKNTPRIDYGAIKPNEIGEIPIVMLHGLTAGAPPADYMCSVRQFKAFLQRLYDQGFRMVSLNDVLDNNITVPAGRSPVVFTFDDGMPSAFSLKKQPDGSLAPAENCCVDIMEKFEKEHPDFGHAGTFYINCDVTPFKGDGTVEQSLKYLADHGYEIGNHTFTHVYLNRKSREGVQKEMAQLDKFVSEKLPGYKIRTMAYPYGSKPSKEYALAVLEGSYGGVTYHYDAALRERPVDGATAPNNIKFNPLFLPRVRASDNACMDLGWYLKHYKKDPSMLYISDGDPNVISVPARLADKVNKESFTKGNKLLYIY